MKKIHWMELKIYDSDGFSPDRHSDLFHNALAEFRGSGEMTEFLFIDPTDPTQGNKPPPGIDLSEQAWDPWKDDWVPSGEAGPEIEEIDWDGF